MASRATVERAEDYLRDKEGVISHAPDMLCFLVTKKGD